MAAAAALESSVFIQSTTSGSEQSSILAEHRLPSLPERRRVAPPTEIELKFYVPEDVGARLQQGHHKIKIEQHVLHSAVVPKLIEKLGISSRVAGSDELTTARVRQSVYPDGSRKFLLEFKSPRFDDVSRWEFPVSISRDLYTKLSRECSVGSVKKERYIIPGLIYSSEGPIKVKFQLDKLIASGPKMKAISAPFFTADIEVPERALIKDLRKGKHSFDFLRECVELNSLDNELSKPLSSRTLARKGFGDKQEWAIRKLDKALARAKKR